MGSRRFHHPGTVRVVLALPMFVGAAMAQAQPTDRDPAGAQARQARSLAATCAACHGTDGRPVAGSAIKALAGVPQQVLLEQLLAFRDASRPFTVMQQLSKGYSPEQIRTLAAYFSNLGK